MKRTMNMSADRMDGIPFSGVRAIFEKANQLQGDGHNVVHLEIGRPDFDTPDHIKVAAKQALDRGEVHYTSNYGIAPLREAIARKLSIENQLDYSPENEIVVTSGVSEGIMISMMAFLNPGDEVLIPEPLFPAYLATARMAGASPVMVPVSGKNGYQPDMLDFQKKLTNRTKMMVFSNPGNPTGVTLKKETLKEIAEFSIKHNLLVMVDEIYEKIIYGEPSFTSLASLPGMRGRTITLNGFSKAYSMTGWRLGYLAADADLIKSLIRIHQFSVVCSASFSQWGALAALESSQDCVRLMVDEYDRRRRLIIKELETIPVLDFVRPDGAFYVYINTDRLGETAYEFSEKLLNNHYVAVVPWDNSHIRISYANSYELIQLAMSRIQDAALCYC